MNNNNNNNMSSPSSSSSSSSTPLFVINHNNYSVTLLPPPLEQPWTSTARIALYKYSPPPYLTATPPVMDNALIRKRPGRPTGPSNKKRALMMSGASDVMSESGDSSDQDPAKLKRMVSNRISARNSRIRKQEYVESLKKAVTIEEDKIAELAPKVKDYQCLNIFLRNENIMLRQRVESIERLQAAKEAESMAMQKQIDDLVCYLDIAARIHAEP
ncbi:unnamed protein product [Linum trigynum]|uniref:BZIP domain-containing protein n=1 Tax=Linum trigynum TaxID=586398 RepID=A0AAV2DZ44_9ROSI